MYIKNIEFIETDEFGCFPKGTTLELSENIVLLVGDQGTGKSTLLKILQNQTKCAKIQLTKIGQMGVDTFYFDSEKMNPRITDPQLYSSINGADMGIGYTSAIMSRFKSHGEVLKDFTLEPLKEAKKCIIFLDEPESALSIKNQIALVHEIHDAVKRSCQFVISTHNYYLIKSVEKVLSLDTKSWVSSNDFLNIN